MENVPANSGDPHRGSETVWFGPPLDEARNAVIVIHGRGDSARGILTLAPEFRSPHSTFLAPQATGHSWYPHGFMAPVDRNEPWLSSALERIRVTLDTVGEVVPKERTVLMGFSQGACLALEFAARNAGPYGGVVAFSGGLIGPDCTTRDYPGSLEGTPVFLGCSDVDAHIPVGRVHDSADVMEVLGGTVEKQIYPGMGHTVNGDEITWAHQLLSEVGADSRAYGRNRP